MKKTSGFAVVSLVLGILALGILAIRNSLFLSSFLVLVLVFILAVLATTFGAIAIKQTRKDSNRGGRGIAITGLCLGIIIIVLGVVFLVGLNLTL
jgi:hypothetical protein